MTGLQLDTIHVGDALKEFSMVVGNTVHRMYWAYMAFTVSYLILTHDGVVDCHVEIGTVGLGINGYWGEYNATRGLFIARTETDAKTMVEIAHANYLTIELNPDYAEMARARIDSIPYTLFSLMEVASD